MHHSEETSTMLRALRQLEALDLGRLFGSGIDVTIHQFGTEEREHMGRVTLHAEFFGPVREALHEALRSTLKRRRESLAMQLREVDIGLGLTPPSINTIT